MRLPIPFALLTTLVLIGCKPSETPIDTAVEPPDEELIDDDGDGSPSTEDCDDDDASVNPSAAETCDGRDNNCDGAIDEGLLVTTYDDADADGYGDEATAAEACAPGDGEVAVGGDCDDGDARYNPGAAETDCADPNDYNCDGSTGYADGDNDGYAACEDCDDNDAGVNPAATEICDERDNNCDSL
ncbi:putative metal-binding motif-containing protein, partial [Myxococcota bacterium]|nr:putative metal-binding motif-containing protein [Myxococcota bacterium]